MKIFKITTQWIIRSIICLLLFSGCIESFESSYDDLLGAWEYESVIFYNDKEGYSENYSNAYSNFILDFLDNGTVVLIFPNGTKGYGEWYLEDFQVGDTEEDRAERLILSLPFELGTARLFLWDDFEIRHGNIYANEYMSDGVIEYSLSPI